MILFEDDITALEAIKIYIASNLDEDLRLHTLSLKFSMSVSKMRRQFEEYFHQSIYQYIHEQRMNLAQSLLLAHKKSVSEVAIDVGYKDRCSFTRAFIQYFNTKPIDHLKSGSENMKSSESLFFI